MIQFLYPTYIRKPVPDVSRRDEGKHVATQDIVRCHETRVNFQNIHGLDGWRKGWANFGPTGPKVLFKKDDLPARIEPDNIQRELHTVHPEAPIVFCVENEKHALVER